MLRVLHGCNHPPKKMSWFPWLGLLWVLATTDALFTNCYKMKNGADYRGTVHITISGKRCQKWTSQAPQTHTRTPDNYPGRGLGDHNYCRNPDNEDDAWCYTTDPSKRWEKCDIGSPQKYCDTLFRNCHELERGCDYRGTVHITISGKTCQKWTSQAPQTHTRTPDNYPGTGLGDHNYCRNPDNEDDAWCYTMDPSKRWEKCDIGSPEKHCSTLLTDCYEKENGADYRGTVHVTTSGKTCQKWTSQAPHTHKRTPDNYPGKGLGDHNYCRNPDNEKNGWCYTTDPSKRWEECDIGSPEKHCDVETCGVKMISGKGNARIVGGRNAKRGSWPWQAQVLITGRGHHCGGTLISEDYVISAAHCFYGYRFSKDVFKVRLGEHDQRVNEGSEQTFDIECLFIHPNYDRATHNNDIALLKLKRKYNGGAHFGEYVVPACLPWQTNAKEQFNTGHACWISGWGNTRSAGTNNPDILQEAPVPLLAQSVCRQQNAIYGNRLTDKMFCAGYLTGGIDTCQGDSGGPLVCERDGVWTLYGVTSWGLGCAKANAPGIYTRVSEYINWITEKVKSNACP